MNRSFLKITAALPLSVALTSLHSASATEVEVVKLASPALPTAPKPASIVTPQQSLSGASTRPLLIAAPVATPVLPVASNTTPAKQATVVKVALPQPPAPMIAATPSLKPIIVATQPKVVQNAVKPVSLPQAQKPASSLPTLVAINALAPDTKPIQKPVVAARPKVETPVAPATKVLANVDLFPAAQPKPAAPKRLASREARAQQLLLARLDADLATAERRLQRSETRLSEGQRQLGSINNIIKSAMMGLGDEGKGLHPFVRVAQRYLGTPYVWGGESARGFDCSGFIMRVMRDLGYRALPHSAAEQFRYGTPIAKPLLKAGDVVFFANTYKPGVSHVGIYLGRGRFIHAANSQVGTIVSELNSPKWVAHYAGARRLVSQ